MPVLGPRLFLQPQHGGLCCGAAHPWRAGGSLDLASSGSRRGMCSEKAVPREPEVSLVTGTTCSRQHRTRDPKNTSHSLPELSSAWF